MKKILITGTSGAGKTTLANELSRKGYCAISIDEEPGLCSWVEQETGEKHGGKETEMTKEFVDKHDWILDTVRLNELIKSSGQEVAFVLGMPTNLKDFISCHSTGLFGFTLSLNSAVLICDLSL